MSNNYEHAFREAKDFAVHNEALSNIQFVLNDNSLKFADKFDEIVLIMEAAVRSLNKVK